jgi:hypothetical protein
VDKGIGMKYLFEKQLPRQGDQIGRVFAQWATVCFGKLREIY